MDNKSTVHINASNFQIRRNQLLEEAAAGLEQLNNNLSILNNRLQIIHDIGSQFNGPSHLWKSLHRDISEVKEDDINANSIIDNDNNNIYSIDFDKSILEKLPEEDDEKENSSNRFKHITEDIGDENNI